MWVGSGPAGEGGQEGAGREGVGMAAVGAGEFFVAEEILLAVGVAPWFAVGVVVGALGDGAGGIHHGDVVALEVSEVVESVAATVEVAEMHIWLATFR